MTVTERERRRMELVDGSAHRTDLCELLAMREYELDNLKKENAKLRELADSSYTFAFNCYHGVFDQEAFFRLREKYHDSVIWR